MSKPTSIDQARLDRLERMLADLLTNRALIAETLEAVRDALDVKLDERERLTRIERDLTGIRQIFGQIYEAAKACDAEADAEAERQQKGGRRLHLV